jgi:uncharacterized protein (DUF305 family)
MLLKYMTFSLALAALLPVMAHAHEKNYEHNYKKAMACCTTHGHGGKGVCKKMINKSEFMHGMQHSMGKADNEASRALRAATIKMHQGMDAPLTGNPDIDFLKGMISHHQGALEMAKIQLKYGKDVRLKRLSHEIIRAQTLEIDWMNRWLKQLEARKVGE